MNWATSFFPVNSFIDIFWDFFRPLFLCSPPSPKYLLGCPDRRIDRLSHYVLFAFPTFTSRRLSGAISFTPQARLNLLLLPLTIMAHTILASLFKRNSSNLGRRRAKQGREPGPMLGATDLGVADDGECSSHEQAAQIAVTLFQRCCRAGSMCEWLWITPSAQVHRTTPP